MADLFELVGKVSIEGVEDVKNQLGGVTGTAETTGSKFGRVARTVAGAVGIGFGTAAVVNFGKDVVSTTQTFSDSMLRVQSLTGASEEDFNTLSDAAINYGSTTAWTSSQVADAMGYMGLAGWDTQEIMDGLGGTLGLASASGTDLATASDILTDSITAFGYSAADANKFADVLATTQAKSNTTVEGLGEAFKYVAPLAGTYGYSVESVSTALGQMANAGIKGSMAGTSMASIITRLATNTNGARDAVEDLGISFYNQDGTARDLSDVLMEMCDATSGMTAEQKANFAQTVAGQEAQKGLLAILNQGSGTYAELQTQLENCSGSASDMSGTMEGGIGGAIRTVQSAWEGFKIRLGQTVEAPLTDVLQGMATFVTETLVPAMESLVAKIQDVISWFKEHQTIVELVTSAMIVLTAAFVSFKAGAAIQSVVQGFQSAQVALSLLKLETAGASLAQAALNGQMTFGQIVMGLLTGQISLATAAQSVLNMVMSANPIAIVVMAIGALIAIFVLLWNKCEGFRNFWISLWENIQTIASTVVTAVGEFLTNLGEFFTGLWENITSLAATVGDFFTGLGETISTIWETICNAIQVAIMFIAELFTAAFEIITLPFQLIWQNCGDTITAIWETITTTISTALSAIGSVISTVFSAISSVITSIWSAISGFFTSIWSAIRSTVTSAVTAISSVVSSVFSAISGVVSGIMNSIRSVITSVWNSIKSVVTSVVNGIKTAISTGLNGALSVVSTVLGNIKNKFTSIFNAVKTVVQNAINAIKAKFNFTWSLPHLKLPHPKITGSFSLNPPSVPHFSIDWYKKAMNDPMIMTSPTAFGIDNKGNIMAGGEAGSEVVSGTDTLMAMISEAVKAQNEETVIVISKIYALLAKYLPEVSAMQLVTDTGVLVGEIAPKMDAELEKIRRWR